MFCKLTYRKKTSSNTTKFTATFIGDNSSITNIAVRNCNLSIIGIAQSIFEIIDYRHRFSTERFIVPITDHGRLMPTVTLCIESAGSWYVFLDRQLDWLIIPVTSSLPLALNLQQSGRSI